MLDSPNASASRWPIGQKQVEARPPSSVAPGMPACFTASAQPWRSGRMAPMLCPVRPDNPPRLQDSDAGPGTPSRLAARLKAARRTRKEQSVRREEEVLMQTGIRELRRKPEFTGR